MEVEKRYVFKPFFEEEYLLEFIKKEGKVIGVKYFSSQFSTNGLGVKEEYFGDKPRSVKIIFVERLESIESWSLLRVSKTSVRYKAKELWKHLLFYLNFK